VLSLPPADAAERASLMALITQERDGVARALMEPPVPVRVRVFESREAFERATGLPWFSLGTVRSGEAQFVPLSILRERGMLERTVRRQLVHLTADRSLPERPAWVREGVALYFSGSETPLATRAPCPQDAELQRPTSIGALADAYSRARACVDRQISSGRDWRRVR
jgi:hypothetical protein